MGDEPGSQMTGVCKRASVGSEREQVRSPCPGLNAAANHGFIPCDGKDIAEEDIIIGLKNAFNIGEEVAKGLFKGAIGLNPNHPNATTFSLDDLGGEGNHEHDASLSRKDRFFGDPVEFDDKIWNDTLGCFPTDNITVPQLALARESRRAQSRATNPEHKFTTTNERDSWVECTTFFTVMADGRSGQVNKAFVDYLFRHERLPTEIGWQRRDTELQPSELSRYVEMLKEATAAQEA
ncbi:sterigmatocystin biosynthesis peroxidase-like protein 2 [Elsinoe australis]|uniref:Sterigmatocystin biosynthesis peroxidase-like protein 2 n=1 Tax=Elsinoe australis TaxID=40998 RepID=A0A4U7B4G2_9PEZI|nr:sterigmatocystin biosynthesis peroxidase-like protein 2 [Elsinoe australis]